MCRKIFTITKIKSKTGEYSIKKSKTLEEALTVLIQVLFCPLKLPQSLTPTSIRLFGCFLTLYWNCCWRSRVPLLYIEDAITPNWLALLVQKQFPLSNYMDVMNCIRTRQTLYSMATTKYARFKVCTVVYEWHMIVCIEQYANASHNMCTDSPIHLEDNDARR
jgi:hypothetical protein